jgi:hypothetical protein
MNAARRAILAVAVGALVACPVTLLTIAGASSRCQEGPIIASLDDTWTPHMVLNSPWLGRGYGNVTLGPGGGRGVFGIPAALKGGVEAYFEIVNWTIYTAVPAGPLATCGGGFIVVLNDTLTSVTTGIPVNPPDPMYQNDSAEPNTVGTNGSAPPPLFYDARFSTATSTLTTCGGGPVTQDVVSSYIRVGVGFEYDSQWVVAGYTIPVVTYFIYEFPANTGSWAIDNLSADGGPGGGWAFSYLGPCS